MIKLILYGLYDGVSHISKIASYAEYNRIYQYVSDYITPDEKTIHNFIKDNSSFLEYLIELTLITAFELEMSDFEHLCVDGTIKKANCNKYNLFNKEDISMLIDYYSGSILSDDEIEKLSKPCRNFIKRTDLSDETKLERLLEMKFQIEDSGQNTIAVNDYESRWMLNKNNETEPSMNIQAAVDSESKLVCGLDITQEGTDHYQLPEIGSIALDYLPTKPEYISADTGYHTSASFNFLEENQIQGLIPSRTQTRKATGRASENKFHKDNMKYDYEKKAFICPNNQYLYLKHEYVDTRDENGNPLKRRQVYSNYKACKNCKDKNECCNGKHRSITEYMNPYALDMRELLETEEGKEMFKQRSRTVEAPFGTLKRDYHLDSMPISGISKVKSTLVVLFSAYNLKLIYRFIMDQCKKI